MWGTVLKRDLLGEVREEDKFYTWDQIRKYLISEIEKQGEHVVIQNIDVSHIEDLHDLFRDITDGVKTLDLSGWKTSGVKYMSNMFYYCKNLESLNVSGWDTSNVEDMTAMFRNCSHIRSLDLSCWDVSNVKDMSYMFFQCEGLKSLNLSGWDTSNVKDMSWMFSYCKNLKSLDLSGWDTSNAEDMGYMFKYSSVPYKTVDNKIVKLCGEQY